jgi:superfamily II DNA helicase RecQ
MGPHPAEQIVLVIGTGSGKSLIFMVGISVIDTRTTILVLPIVILRGDILRHYYLIGIRPLISSVNIKQSVSLVIVSVEAIYTETFLDYARDLVSRQKLDRIVINKGYLIITTSDYYPCIV